MSVSSSRSKVQERMVEVVGTVLAVDVKRRTLRLHLADGHFVRVTYDLGDEATAIQALNGYRDKELRVKGRGRLSDKGGLKAITRVDELDLRWKEIPSPSEASDDSDIPIWEQIVALTKDAPQAELDKLPKDLAVNLDSYIYGTQKFMSPLSEEES